MTCEISEASVNELARLLARISIEKDFVRPPEAGGA